MTKLFLSGTQVSDAGLEQRKGLAEPPENLLDLDAAIDKLALTDRPTAELVKLRYFTGLTIPQVAKLRSRLTAQSEDFCLASD